MAAGWSDKGYNLEDLLLGRRGSPAAIAATIELLVKGSCLSDQPLWRRLATAEKGPKCSGGAKWLLRYG